VNARRGNQSVRAAVMRKKGKKKKKSILAIVGLKEYTTTPHCNANGRERVSYVEREEETELSHYKGPRRRQC